MITSDNEEIKKKQIEKISELFNSQYPEAHKVAAWAISLVGEPAVPIALSAIPSTRRMGPSLLSEIEWAIKLIGSDAIPHLKDVVNSDNPIAGEFATKLLKEMGFRDSNFIIQALDIKKFEDQFLETQGMDIHRKERTLREFMSKQVELINALGDIGDDQSMEKLFELLPHFLDDRDFSPFKDKLILATKDAIRKSPDIATPYLIKLFESPKLFSNRVLSRSIDELLVILAQSSTPEAREFLMNILTDSSQEKLHKDVIRAIRLGLNPEPTLIDLISHPQKTVQQLAVDALSVLKKSQ